MMDMRITNVGTSSAKSFHSIQEHIEVKITSKFVQAATSRQY